MSGSSDLSWNILPAAAGPLAVPEPTDVIPNNTTQRHPASWRIEGIGDFNGDGKDDILWRNDSGALAVRIMNGLTVAATGSTGSIISDWHVI